MIDPGIKGRVAIVTGANQGIGAAAARALADQGVAVFLTYLRLGPDDPGVQATGLASYAIARAQAGESVAEAIKGAGGRAAAWADRKSTRLNSSHVKISYAVFCLK